MPGKLLGLDISEDSITAVQVKSVLKGYQVTACAMAKIEENGGMENALKGILDQNDLKSDFYLASIPGTQISCRNLQMPFKDPKKIRQTLPFEIETMVPFPIDDVMIDFGIIDRSDQSEILAVSIKKKFVSEYLAQLQSCEIDPDILDIRCMPIISWLLKQEGTHDNGLLLDIEKKITTMVLYAKRNIVLMRTFAINADPIAFSMTKDIDGDDANTQAFEQIKPAIRSLPRIVQNTIHAFNWQRNKVFSPEKVYFTGIDVFYPQTENILSELFDIPAEQVDLSKDKRIRMNDDIVQIWDPKRMNTALAFAVRDAKKGRGFNFRKDEFKKEKHRSRLKKELQKAGIFLTIILSFLAVDVGVDYYLMKKRYSMLDQKITDVFRHTFPDVKRIMDPIQQMKVKIDEIKKPLISEPSKGSNVRVLDVLRDISQRTPRSLDVHVTHMAIDPDTVRISGRTDTFNTVDSIKTGLMPSKYFDTITISSANLDQKTKKIRFEMKLQRAR